MPSNLTTSKLPFQIMLLAAFYAIALAGPAQAQAVDVAEAEALAKMSNCTKCHSVDKKKDGPPFKQTAAKYKDKRDAEATLIKHITTGPKIKIDDIEENHQIVKTKDKAAIENLVRYILSR